VLLSSMAGFCQGASPSTSSRKLSSSKLGTRVRCTQIERRSAVLARAAGAQRSMRTFSACRSAMARYPSGTSSSSIVRSNTRPGSMVPVSTSGISSSM
jgi:hypothetical protein